VIDGAMSECFRGCGAWVPTDGPAICGACAAGDQVRETEAARSAAARAEWESRRVQSERSYRGFTIRTIGYGIYLEFPPKRDSRDIDLFTNDARALAAKLVEAADYVESLKSPYKDGAA
jgi:hypothetical protein